MQLDIDSVRPIGERILVRRYEKPEQVRGIWLPEEARVDHTQSLWEVVRVSERAKEKLALELEPDDIIQTRPWRGIFLNESDAAEAPRYAIIEAKEVINVIKW